MSTALRAAEAIREAGQGSLAGSPADDEVPPSEAQKAANSARVDTLLFAAARNDVKLAVDDCEMGFEHVRGEAVATVSSDNPGLPA